MCQFSKKKSYEHRQRKILTTKIKLRPPVKGTIN